MTQILPKLIVFDLDYTLWPFWIDTHVNPPFRKRKNGDIVDSYSTKIKYYPQAPQILERLFEEGYILAVASRTSEINGASQLLNLLDWNKYFTYKEIYPGCKITHFDRIQSKSGITFKDMVFFDDESRNINDLNRHGVLSILVKNGISEDIIKHGLMEFAKQRSNKI